MTPDPRLLREVALAEYDKIKAEQANRIGTRDNLLYATLAGTGAVFAASQGHPAYLLGIPVLTFVLGWTFVANDHLITAIGSYFRDHPVIGSSLGWERDHTADPHRRSRMLMHLARDLTAFVLLGFAALITYWVTSATSVALALVSGIEAAALAVLAWQIVTYANPGLWHWKPVRALSGQQNQ